MMTDRLMEFFDPSRARGPREGPDVGTAASPKNGAERRGMTVSALIGRIKSALAEAFCERVCVVGQLSNVKLHGSGHLYFRLKDASAAIDAAMFRQYARTIRFKPVDGLEVVVEGRVDVYDVRGQLQLYVETMVPKGMGELELAFRQLYEKLSRERLFAPEHKVPLRRFPRAVGIITSRSGAAIRDICRTLRRRWPAVRAYLLDVPVQGEGSASLIARAVRLMDASADRFEIDTIILARGGGSLEDLWSFNEECLARAIYDSRTPIVCGVGHEVDVTIADLAADVRAATPTAAAELAVPDMQDVCRHIHSLAGRLKRAIHESHRSANAELTGLMRSGIFRDPAGRIRVQMQRIDELSHRLRAALGDQLNCRLRRLEPLAHRLLALHPARLADRASAGLDRLSGRLGWVLGGRSKRCGDELAAIQTRLAGIHPAHALALARHRLISAGRQLEAMSHRSVINRGFSVTRVNGNIVRSVVQVCAGDRLETEVSDGKIASRVGDDAGNKNNDTTRRRTGRRSITGGRCGMTLFGQID